MTAVGSKLQKELHNLRIPKLPKKMAILRLNKTTLVMKVTLRTLMRLSGNGLSMSGRRNKRLRFDYLLI